MRKQLGTVVVIAALVAAIVSVVARGDRRESRTAPTVEELRRAATAAIEAAGGEWATMKPRENGAWAAIVIRADLSVAVVFMDDHLQIVRVASVNPVPKAGPASRSIAAARLGAVDRA